MSRNARVGAIAQESVRIPLAAGDAHPLLLSGLDALHADDENHARASRPEFECLAGGCLLRAAGKLKFAFPRKARFLGAAVKGFGVAGM